MDPLACLPHGPPIRVLEHVLEVTPTGACAEHRVAEGPHTHSGLLWAGGLIEGLAQTAALMAAAATGEGRPRPVQGMLVAVRRFDIARAPHVGEVVRYSVALRTRFAEAVLVEAEAHVGEEQVASGRLQFVLRGESA
jgi:predicted hotdog family 3-hydroxylacyl-ACP dehydratase